MTSAVIRPMRGLWRDRHPADVPAGALQRAENVVFRKRGSLNPIEAPAEFSPLTEYPSRNPLNVRAMTDLGDYLLSLYIEGNADVGNVERTDKCSITSGTHYHHGSWRIDARVTVDGRVVLITEAVDAQIGSGYTIETGDHYHYGRWLVDDRVTVDGRVIIVLDRTETLWAPDGTRGIVELPGGETITYESGCANVARYRDRAYLTSNQGLVCVDGIVFDADDQQVPDDARRAGLPAPMFDLVSFVATSDDSGQIATAKVLAAVAIFRRDFDDGSFARSPYSTPGQRTNSSGATRTLTHTVNWTSGIELAVGDKIEVYRTAQADAGTDPGADYLHATTYVLTAADITARYVVISDATPDGALGEGLYTNGVQDETLAEGALNAYFPPPYLRDVVEYKGALLGIMAREYESITTTLVGRWGTLSTASDRAYGWGTRTITGTITAGSKNITGVSAAHMVGIEAGQFIDDAQFPAGTYVDSAAGTTIVATSAALTNNTGSMSFTDVLKINGAVLNAGSLYLLLSNVGTTYVGMHGVPGITMRVSAPVEPAVTSDGHAQVSWIRHYAYGEACPFYVGATNGDNFIPPLGSLSAPTESKSYPHGNRLASSAPDLPESWPLLNRMFLGSADLVRLLRVGDAVYCFADDAVVYRITGTPGDYRADPALYGHRLQSAPAAVSYGDTGYFWSSAGWVRLSDGTLNIVSADRVGIDLRNEAAKIVAMPVDALRLGASPFNWFASAAIDPVHQEVWLRARVRGGDGITYIYSEADNEITEYARIRGLGCVGYARQAGGGGMLVSGLADPDIYTLCQRITGLYEGSWVVEFQRIDLGTPDTLKLQGELALGYTTDGGEDDTLAATVSVHGDMDQGDGSADAVAITLAAAPQRFGRSLIVPVGRRSAQSSQYTVRIERDGDAHKLRWNLEHIAIRFEPTADSTGARS